MKASEIKVGGMYRAKVNGRLVNVRVDAIRTVHMLKGSRPGYDVTNLSTGKTTHFRSAAKFRGPALREKPLTTLDELRARKKEMEAETPGHPRADGHRSGPECDQPVGDEQRPDPTQPKPTSTPSVADAPAPTDSTQPAPSAEPAPRFLRAPRPAVVDTAPHLIVEARAGTGKTFTLIVGIVWMFRDRVPGLWVMFVTKLGFEPVPSPQQQAVWDAMALSSASAKTVKFVAFNKSIVVEFERKWGWVIQELAKAGIILEFSTMHSMGFRAVTKALGRMEPSEWAVRDVVCELLGLDPREAMKRKPVVIKATEDLVGLCKQNLVGADWSEGGEEWAAELEILAAYYDVDLNGSKAEVFDLVPRVLERCRAPRGRISYDDMIWLPVVLGLPVVQYDVLLVDEAQDLNRCQQALAKRAGRRLVLCGDPKQAIYGFAGADSESMARMERELSECGRCQNFGTVNEAVSGRILPCPTCNGIRRCVHLPLTVTRRCGKAIVEEARRIVPDFEAHEGNPEGRVSRAPFADPRPNGISEADDSPTGWKKTYDQLVVEGDFILCRVNAPLVSQCFRFLRAGRKATIQGRDVGAGLISTVKKVAGGQQWENLPVADLVGKLDDWLAAEQAKEQAKRNPSENKLTALQDRHDCLACFAEGARTAGDVAAKIAAVFTDNKESPGIRLSSIHKAKGLEARRVFILRPPGVGPRRDMMQPWELEQERNLDYVSITRAIEELVYVS